MTYHFKPCDRDQLFLLPPSLKEWLPEEHLAWFVLDTISLMDLSQLYQHYRADGWGSAAYEPGMMVALLIYSYCLGERSSRQIERLCQVDIAYRILAANQLPDHSTIARFRRNHLKLLEAIFVEMLKLCHQAGLVKLGVTALDGTKIQGNTSLSSNKTHERIAREVAKMLEEAERIDAEEDRRYGKNNNGDHVPDNLRHREERLKRLKQCKEELEKEAQAREDESKEKQAVRDETEKVTGKKARGKAAKPVMAEEEKQRMKRNITDPDSKPMKNFRGFVQGYNGQAVATEEQIIIAAELTNDCNDQKQVEPMIEAIATTLHEANIEDKCETLLMDAGYCSETNLALEEKKKIEFIVSTKQDAKQRKELGQEDENETKNLPEPKNLKEKMARKLKTERGGQLYKKRGGIIEPVFGQIKTCLKFTRFSMRGLEACKAEWKFICGIHNMMKLYRKQRLQLA